MWRCGILEHSVICLNGNNGWKTWNISEIMTDINKKLRRRYNSENKELCEQKNICLLHSQPVIFLLSIITTLLCQLSFQAPPPALHSAAGFYSEQKSRMLLPPSPPPVFTLQLHKLGCDEDMNISRSLSDNTHLNYPDRRTLHHLCCSSQRPLTPPGH